MFLIHFSNCSNCSDCFQTGPHKSTVGVNRYSYIQMHDFNNNNDKNTHSQKTYHEMQEEDSKSQPMYIFFVFPMFIVLYSVIIYILFRWENTSQ